MENHCLRRTLRLFSDRVNVLSTCDGCEPACTTLNPARGGSLGRVDLQLSLTRIGAASGAGLGTLVPAPLLGSALALAQRSGVENTGAAAGIGRMRGADCALPGVDANWLRSV